MPDPNSADKPPSDNSATKESLEELVRRSLLETAELREVAERVKEISERVSKLTPPPEPLPKKDPPPSPEHP